MTNAVRQAVRRTYLYSCGYCGIHENQAGCELEIDHFRPVSQGGTDDLANLVYCCTACNRYKSDFWPTATNLAAQQRLLHPHQDNYAAHLQEETDGRLTALTATGTFHLARLHLNRLPLIVARRRRQTVARVLQRIEHLRDEQNYAHDTLLHRDAELQELSAQLRRLLE